MPDHELGDAPITNEEHRRAMVTFVQVLNEHFNGKVPPTERKIGVVLLTFPFGDDAGRCNFVSNGVDRADIVTLFKEMIARFEGQPEIVGRA